MQYPLDAELGLTQRRTPQEAREEFARLRRTAAFNQVLIGAVLFLILVGVLPFSFIFWFFVGVLLTTTCMRAIVQHWQTQLQTLAADDGEDHNRQVMFPISRNRGPFVLMTSPGGGLDLFNLQLSMMNRDFSSSDYELLMALDQNRNMSHSQPVSEEDLSRIPVSTHAAHPDDHTGCRNDDDNSQLTCTVCLDSVKEGSEIMTMPCGHKYHKDCIIPWLRQQGQSSTCPMCKTKIFQSNAP